jgi:hypothetical protein
MPLTSGGILSISSRTLRTGHPTTWIAGVTACAFVLCVSSPAAAQGNFGGLNFTGAISFDIPTGSLRQDVSSGIGLMIRTSTRRAGSWALRSGLAFERFSGKGSLDNMQLFNFFGGELLHYTGDYFYQYAGVGIYSTRVNQKDQATTGLPTLTATRRASTLDIGFHGGLGVNIPVNGAMVFIESGIVQVLSTQPTSWVPVRVGLKL